MGDRYGYLRPLVIGIVGVVATGVWFVFCEDGTEFAITYTLWSAAYYFVTPYFVAERGIAVRRFGGTASL